jgi:hypothetical protein
VNSRLPRFKRASAVASITLTERDHQIIRLVRRHRFLRSHQIVALIGDRPQQLLRRLHLLYHHGYLERPRAQLNYYHQGGSQPMVYGLGNKGAVLLKRECGVRWGEKNRSVGRMFLEHALLVSEVMVAIELACRKAGVRLLMDEELPLRKDTGAKRLSFKWHVKVNSRLKLGVIPDRVFALEFPDASGSPTRTFFFLEADRGTMPVTRRHLTQTSFHRKLLAYEATWAQSLHETRFDFHRFRVLTVTTSVERVQSLANACAQLKSGHGLFLFADRSVLGNPADIFSALWQTGRPGESTTLLN